jgi:hypothetical protein
MPAIAVFALRAARPQRWPKLMSPKIGGTSRGSARQYCLGACTVPRSAAAAC